MVWRIQRKKWLCLDGWKMQEISKEGKHDPRPWMWAWKIGFWPSHGGFRSLRQRTYVFHAFWVKFHHKLYRTQESVYHISLHPYHGLLLQRRRCFSKYYRTWSSTYWRNCGLTRVLHSWRIVYLYLQPKSEFLWRPGKLFLPRYC